MPISNIKHPRNFLTKITTYQKIDSEPNSWSILPELLPILLDMITKNNTGTINLVNPGLITHNEILEMYRNIVDPNFTWENISTDEKQNSPEKANHYQNTQKLISMYPNILNIKDSLKLCLENYKKSL